MAESEYHFERLTPIDNMDFDVYEEAIDYVFDNSGVKNVAISGAYSACKTSVLASYKKKHSDLHFLHISLAHFKSPDQEDETEVFNCKKKTKRFFASSTCCVMIFLFPKAEQSF